MPEVKPLNPSTQAAPAAVVATAAPTQRLADARAGPVANIRALAWAGQHAQAVQQASAELAPLAATDVSNARLDLLDARAESLMALGDLGSAAADAEAMRRIAQRTREAVHEAQALNREALVQIRAGKARAASITAATALAAARRAATPGSKRTA